jgi:hypothetical protein
MARPRKASSAGAGDGTTLFLRDLRALRGQAGLERAELAARAHYPEDTIKTAERGPGLPVLPVLEAYVRGCGASPAEWEDRWRQLIPGTAPGMSLPSREPSAARRHTIGRSGTPAGPLPDPLAAVAGPTATDRELASRVVAGLEAHALAADAARNGAYAHVAAPGPVTAPPQSSPQPWPPAPKPSATPPQASPQAPAMAPTTAAGAAGPAASAPATRVQRRRRRRARAIIVVIVATLLAAGVAVWLGLPSAAVAHRARGTASPGAAAPTGGNAPARTTPASPGPAS